MAAAVQKSQHIVVRDFLHESDAARAHDAALVIENDPLAEIDALRLFDLLLDKPGLAFAELDRKFLQAALPGLVADRAVERMVDQKKFHHAVPAFLDHRGRRLDAHTFRDLGGTRNDRARAPGNLRASVRAKNRLAVRCHLRHAELDEAHPAVARRAELRVIAIVRDEFPALHAGFDESRPLGKLPPLAVHLHIDHCDFRSAHDEK